MALQIRPNTNTLGKALDPDGTLSHEQLRGEDFSGLKFDNLDIWDSTFEDCCFDRIKARVFGAAAGGKVSEFIDCTFRRAMLSKLALGGRARFIICSFDNARLTNWICESVDFIDCTFDGASLRSMQIWGSINEPAIGKSPAKHWTNDISGNDFSQAKICDIDFRTGVDLTQQKLPTGPDYLYTENVPAALDRGHQVLASLPPGLAHDTVEFLLEWIDTQYQDGQLHAFHPRLKTYPDEMWIPLHEAMNEAL
ncbi:MAG: hypothetical protein Q4C87_00960 [Actinomycetaceae bacterium]|nr:hypothetical protein [Actinomycetaceae bacterium]